MVQLVVRNLPEGVQERLQRRADQHRHSLEAEVLLVLAEVPELPSPLPDDGEGWATKLARKMQEIGVSNDDIDDLERAIADGRRQWRTLELAFDK